MDIGRAPDVALMHASFVWQSTHDQHDVLTLDADFSVYRKHGRVPLKLIYPGSA